MAPRRSARLKGTPPATGSTEAPPNTPGQSKKPLRSVPEGDETPKLASNTPNRPLPTTPSSKSIVHSKSRQFQHRPPPKTPNTGVQLKPELGEMHPSKVQQSTSKQPDTGLVLGFRPIETDPKAPGSSLKHTPSKQRLSYANPMGDLSSPFKFASEDSQLSEEARKLMENIREDAARIKAQMVIEKESQKRKDEEAERVVSGRVIAKPRGKAGRFSEAHMEQFKKMDSIEAHPSAWRARSNAEQPAKSLKRTLSKTRLYEPEAAQSTKSPSDPAAAPPVAPTNGGTKRLKESKGDEGSIRRPLSKGDQSANRDAANLGPTTPCKPTTANSSSVKYPNTTKAPAIPRSPSTKQSFLPRTPQTDFRSILQNGSPSIGKLKSILRRPQPLFSTDPVKIAAGTHLPAPAIGAGNLFLTASAKKRVDFSASTKLSDDDSEENPGEPMVTDAPADVVMYPTLPPVTPSKINQDAHVTPSKMHQDAGFHFTISTPTIRKVSFSEKPVRHLSMMARSPIPHGLPNKKRLRDDTDIQHREAKTEEADDRSTKRVKVNPAGTPSAIKTPSPVKHRQLPQSTPRRMAAPTSAQRKVGLTRSRLSFLSRPKARR